MDDSEYEYTFYCGLSVGPLSFWPVHIAIGSDRIVYKGNRFYEFIWPDVSGEIPKESIQKIEKGFSISGWSVKVTFRNSKVVNFYNYISGTRRNMAGILFDFGYPVPEEWTEYSLRDK